MGNRLQPTLVSLAVLALLYPHEHHNVHRQTVAVGRRWGRAIHIYRCSRCGLERTQDQIADEMRARLAAAERLRRG